VFLKVSGITPKGAILMGNGAKLCITTSMFCLFRSAWNELKNISKKTAMDQYIAKILSVDPSWMNNGSANLSRYVLIFRNFFVVMFSAC